jgi:hypothetical protein
MVLVAMERTPDDSSCFLLLLPLLLARQALPFSSSSNTGWEEGDELRQDGGGVWQCWCSWRVTATAPPPGIVVAAGMEEMMMALAALVRLLVLPLLLFLLVLLLLLFSWCCCCCWDGGDDEVVGSAGAAPGVVAAAALLLVLLLLGSRSKWRWCRGGWLWLFFLFSAAFCMVSFQWWCRCYWQC